MSLPRPLATRLPISARDLFFFGLGRRWAALMLRVLVPVTWCLALAVPTPDESAHGTGKHGHDLSAAADTSAAEDEEPFKVRLFQHDQSWVSSPHHPPPPPPPPRRRRRRRRRRNPRAATASGLMLRDASRHTTTARGVGSSAVGRTARFGLDGTRRGMGVLCLHYFWCLCLHFRPCN